MSSILINVSVKCQGNPITIVTNDPTGSFVRQMQAALKPRNYPAIFGFWFKLTDRLIANEVDANEVDANEADVDEADVDANEADEVDANEADEVDVDEADEEFATVKYELKSKKTRNAPNGRQQSRHANVAELKNDIRKRKNNMTKVLRTNAKLSLHMENSEDKIRIAVVKPTKQEMRKKSQQMTNRRDYKPHAN
jgi:hypothetical protein